MFPVLPLLLTSGALAAGAMLARKAALPLPRHAPQSGLLIEQLCQPKAFANLPRKETARFSTLQTQIGATKQQMAALDAAYHRWMHQHIDPWFGRQRHQQKLTLANGRPYEPTAQEKVANHQLTLSVTALTLVGIAAITALPLVPLVIGIGLYLSWPLYQMAYEITVRERRFSFAHINTFYSLVLWLGGYYLIGVIFGSLVGIIGKLQALSENDIRDHLINIFGELPHQVWALVNDVEVAVPFDEVRAGDILVLDVGQMVPVDGVIVKGIASLDQHMLTGEAQPVEKEVGDRVLAATVVLAGRIYVQVEKTGAETTAAQIGEILNHTTQHNLSLLHRALQVTDRSLLPMTAAGVLSLPFVGATNAIALLGCNFMPIMMALAPLTLLNALNQSSQHGLLVKAGEALEKLHDIDTVVFDKTGTLTLEQPHLVAIHRCGELDEPTVLTLAAAAEHRQTHPIAQAILAAAQERKLSLPASEEGRYEIGYGIKVRVASAPQGAWPRDSQPPPLMPAAAQLVCVGSQRFMASEGVVLPAAIQALTTTAQAEGHSLVFVAVDQLLVGVLELKATVRHEAQAVIGQLRQRGLKLYIISGDQEQPTRTLANALGMDGYFANTLPERKAGLVEELQRAGHRVCFIGDGINDAIALRQADVSVSLRGATTAATDTAQIVLMNAHLTQLLTLFNLADSLHSNMNLNLKVATVSSFLSGAGVLFFHLGFALVESVFALNFFVGVNIACLPLLAEPEQQTDPHPAT